MFALGWYDYLTGRWLLRDVALASFVSKLVVPADDLILWDLLAHGAWISDARQRER